MDRPCTVECQYASFLVRIWCEVESERLNGGTAWHGEIEHIQTGQRASFSTLAGLVDCLQALLLAGENASSLS
jgi:hypothetical protein